jgi:hypothetical protein
VVTEYSTGDGIDRVSVTFPRFSPGRLRPTGIVHHLLWLGVLLASVRAAWRTKAHRSGLVIAMLLWLAMNASLHMVFGTDLFLYSCQWTFAIVALSALPWRGAISPRARTALTVALVLLIVLQAAGNASLLQELRVLFALR